MLPANKPQELPTTVHPEGIHDGATPGVSPGLPGEQAEGSGSRTFSFPQLL